MEENKKQMYDFYEMERDWTAKHFMKMQLQKCVTYKLHTVYIYESKHSNCQFFWILNKCPY